MSRGQKRASEVSRVSSEDEREGVSSSAAKRVKREGVNGTHSRGRSDGSDDGSETSDAGTDAEAQVSDNGTLSVDEDEERKVHQVTQLLATQNRERAGGEIAQCGIIESLDLINFMNHTHFTMHFGPEVNFVVGHNGTGKSAILTAIIIGLGGNAASTVGTARESQTIIDLNDRGRSVVGLIQDGKERADIKIKIKNQGDDAYKPARYGKSIIVERTLLRTGGGSYRLKSASGELISNKKKDLTAILDHLCIQIDNPIAILSQDAAKTFLSSNSAKAKYLAFRKGTQLEQLGEEYNAIYTTIISIQAYLKRNHEALPTLQDAAVAAQERLNASEAMHHQTQRLAELKDRLAWSYVVLSENALERAAEELELEQARRPEIEEKIANAIDEVEIANNKLLDVERRVNDYSAGDTHDNERFKELKELITAVREAVKKLHTTRREIDSNYKTAKANVEVLDERIAVEKEKLERANADAHGQKLEQIEELTATSATLGEEMQQARQDSKAAQDSLDGSRSQLTQAREALNACRNEVDGQQARLRDVQSHRTNALTCYGPNMDILLKKINSFRSWQRKPIGPIGLHVKVRDRSWSRLLESLLGDSLNAFIVTSQRDRKQLSQMMLDVEHKGSQIWQQKDTARLDVQAGEPPAAFVTVLRILTIDSDLVRDALIDHNRIETAILVKDNQEAITLMRKPPENVGTCYTMDGFRIGGVRGGSGMFALAIWKGLPRLTTDLTEHIRECQQAVADAESRLQDSNRELAAVNAQMTTAAVAKRAADERGRQLKRRMETVEDNIRRLQEEIKADEPANMQHLLDSKMEATTELELYHNQFVANEEQVNLKMQELRPLVTEQEELQTKQRDREAVKSRLRRESEEHLQEKITKETHQKHYKESLQKQELTITAKQRIYDERLKMLDSNMLEASDICERPSTIDMTPGQYIRECESIEKLMRQHQQREGMTYEQLQEAMISASKALEAAKAQGRAADSLTNAMIESYKARVDRWARFQDNLAILTKAHFGMLTSQRGYQGSMRINHDQKTLELDVQTDEQQQSAGRHTRRDTKSLSGGEKSFSTVCLLLAMWECIASPVRCLDEFDVFMDAVNRRIAVKMLIETARNAPGRQHIFISPQGMPPTLKVNHQIRVHKMADNVRGQGTLP